ncbi:protein shisa-2-like [Hemicordylus capensis]|uniref:protein shisa-2-like n=1 Tax=Hemicordylus capensis TaxID=884348 RepID=UPI002302C710|nr:protein shisa-2-like [Hemicordylus capensis]
MFGEKNAAPRRVPPQLGRVSAVAKALRCALLLSPAPGSVSERTGGEFCRLWIYDLAPPRGVFRCPGVFDPDNATLCCGTCRLPSCCVAREDRLDQVVCHRELRGFSNPPPREEPYNWDYYFLWFVLVSLVLILLFLGLGSFCTNIQDCLWSCLLRQCQQTPPEANNSPARLQITCPQISYVHRSSASPPSDDGRPHSSWVLPCMNEGNLPSVLFQRSYNGDLEDTVTIVSPTMTPSDLIASEIPEPESGLELGPSSEFSTQ